LSKNIQVKQHINKVVNFTYFIEHGFDSGMLESKSFIWKSYRTKVIHQG